MVMEKPTPQEVIDNIVATLPPKWFDGGFMPIYQDSQGIWLRRPGRQTIIRIEVKELPRDQWPSLKDA